MLDYGSILKKPPEDSRGFTRWWWYGCCVEKAEIDRELDFMREAGIGGVELQILYPVQEDDPERGFHNIPFGSPEFYDILAYTKDACHSRGMKLDITPGSSWPYGGPFVGVDDAQQEAIPYQYDITGTCDFSCDFTTRFAGDVCAAVMGRMEKSVMIPDTIIDITDRFQVKPLFGWPWGTELKTIHVPEGDWKIVFFVISMHHNHVGKPGRNAEGLVIDHCSRHAMDTFLNNMVEPIARHVPGVNAWFCDSIEVEGHNWSGVLLDEFKRRRGYDLKKYIYALWGQVGDLSPRVRYDYFKTMSELTIENFFDPLTEFAHRHKGLSRIQAHGTWGDILRVYAAADIPEGETFGDHRILEVNTIHRRLAASAGHVYGKNIISNETFTWLKRPRFTETLEEMKAAVDAVFADGMNMIVNHGYAYSPEKAGKRGWPFYASTHINHTTPWWGQYHHLAEYISRVSAMLRVGYPRVRVAVYLPTADVYSENMMSELHLAMRMEEYLGRARMDAIQKAGYWFDYINDEALTKLGETRDGGLWIGENRYEAILLVGCTRLEPETAEALDLFAKLGGLLIAAGGIPLDSCGLVDAEKKARRVRLAMGEAFSCLTAHECDDADQALIDLLHARLTPDIITDHRDTLGFVHRVAGQDHIYFLTNISDEGGAVSVRFPGMTGPCRLLRTVPDASGQMGDMPFRRDGDEFTIDFSAHESCFAIFSDTFKSEQAGAIPEAQCKSVKVENWRLTIPERGVSFDMAVPQSWETLPGHEDFSGLGSYEAAVTCECEPRSIRLRLKHLSCAAGVYVNGRHAGDIWTSPYEIEIGEYLKPGENRLEIRVASTLVNEMRAVGPEWPRCEAEIPAWPYYGKVINDHRQARMNTRREHEEQLTPLPSGIWGDVELIYTC